MVSAVNVPPGQIDNGVRPVNLSGPFAYRLGVPADHLPASAPGVTAEDHHLMTIRDEGTGEQRADLPGPTGENNFHASSLRMIFSAEILRLQP